MKYYSEISGYGQQTAIFLPGTGWAGSFGTPIATALGDSFTTHMIDLPGIGKSDGLDGVVKVEDAANWLNNYLEEKQIEKVVVIGHSLGGGIGLSFAHFFPEKVEKLVLLDIGFAKIERFPVQMFGSVAYVLPFISVLHSVFGQKFLGKETDEEQKSPADDSEEKIKEKIASFGLSDGEFIRNAILNQQSASLKGMSLLLALYRCNMPKMLQNLKVPCLVLYGNRADKSVKVQGKIKRQISRIKQPNVMLKELSGGHYAHVSDDRALGYITSFCLGEPNFIETPNPGHNPEKLGLEG